jgi:Bardet-Biedl syndrome 2 protein
VGLYDGSRRMWRYKSKHTPVAYVGFDLDGDGQVELVTGWSNGKVAQRRGVVPGGGSCTGAA